MIQRAAEIKHQKGLNNPSDNHSLEAQKKTRFGGVGFRSGFSSDSESIKSNLIVINKPIKILVATGARAPEIGNAATYTQFLKEVLPDESKDKIRIITLSWNEVSRWPRLISHLIYFFKAVNRGRYCDVVYALDPVNTGWPAWLASVFLKKPFILKVTGDYVWERMVRRHGDHPEIEGFSQISPEYSFYTNWLLKIQNSIAERARQIVVPNLYLKKMVADWGIDSNKIVVIPDTFDSIKGIGDKNSLRKKMGVQGEIIVAVGDLDKLKNFEVLIEAMPDIILRHIDTKLLIVGEGPEREILEARIQELGLEESVMLTGRIEKKLLYTYLRLADVFVSSSLFEGFSYTLLEAMSLGVPVVATKVGGNSELVETEVNGFLIPTKQPEKIVEAVEKIFSSHSLAETFSLKAQAKAASFDQEKIAKQFISFILRIVKDQG